MKQIIALALLASLSACANLGPPHPLPDGAPAALGETVKVGSLLATPGSVQEDSRCPYNVQCIQAGRVVVSTRIDGRGWRETVPLVLGEPYTVQGTTITVARAFPDKIAERDVPRHEYRFIFEGGA